MLVHPWFWTGHVCQDASAQLGLGAAVSDCSHSLRCQCSSPCAKEAANRTSSYSLHAYCLGENWSLPGTLGNLLREERSRTTKWKSTQMFTYCTALWSVEEVPNTPACLSTDPQPVSNLLTVSWLILKQFIHFLRELPDQSIIFSILNLSTIWLKHFLSCYYCIVQFQFQQWIFYILPLLVSNSQSNVLCQSGFISWAYWIKIKPGFNPLLTN